MLYRLTFGFSGNGQGWGETHSMKNSSTDPAVLLPILANMGQKRADFLGAPYAVTHVRLAKVYDDLANTPAKGSVLLKQRFTAINPTLTGDAEPGNVCLLVRGTPNVTDPALAPFAGRQNVTFLGSPPDAAVNLGGNVNLGNAGLGAALGTFYNLLIANNVGWFAVRRVDDVKIATSTQNTDGTVSILLQRNVNPVPTLFFPQTVRVRRVNSGKSPLNGALLGYFNLAGEFQTSDVIGIPTTQIGGFMRVYSTVPVHLPYSGFLTELLTGEHKRGRPFGTPRGRAVKRVRG
jgi:hypothetical protein